MFTRFFNKYFIDPILRGTGYNVVNTIVYAIILVIAAIGIYKLLERLRIKIDRKFFIGLIPFICLGSVLRVLEDIKILDTYFLVSPLIYFIIFLLTLASLLVSIAISKKTKIPYHHILFFSGLVTCLFAASFLIIVDLAPLLIVLGIASLLTILILFIKRFYKPKILSDMNTFLLSTHLFDASTAFTALAFSKNPFVEQHVLANLLIDLIGPIAMFIMKIAVLLPVLWILDKEVKNPQENNFLKLIIFILGFAPGLRNLLLMMAVGL
ncbi:MAG: DUF63 family protein [Candidatus Aenigmatarchaeota archaeon]